VRNRLLAALAIAAAGLAYLVSPIDLIPDVVPLIGLLDDVVVGLLSALGAAGVAASAWWLERRGAALSAPKPAYEPIPADEIRGL
jgi:uncharacterized membrane protein YkvA (DUF1232 family)